MIVGELRNDGSVRRRKLVITMIAEAVWRVRGGGRGGGTEGGIFERSKGLYNSFFSPLSFVARK